MVIKCYLQLQAVFLRLLAFSCSRQFRVAPRRVIQGPEVAIDALLVILTLRSLRVLNASWINVLNRLKMPRVSGFTLGMYWRGQSVPSYLNTMTPPAISTASGTLAPAPTPRPDACKVTDYVRNAIETLRNATPWTQKEWTPVQLAWQVFECAWGLPAVLLYFCIMCFIATLECGAYSRYFEGGL